MARLDGPLYFPPFPGSGERAFTTLARRVRIVHGILAQEGGPLEVVFSSTEVTYLWVILGISLVALVFAYYLVREVLAARRGPRR